MKKITIHTDGACVGNPGPGGWAAILRYGAKTKEISGGEAATTNNRMELQAAIQALAAVREPCQIELFTDSEYLKNGMLVWVPAWKVHRWGKSRKKPVKNEDLWRQLDELAARHRVQWKWLKGHNGDPLNERCDQLACAAAAEIRKRHTPEQLKQLKEEFQVQRRSSSSEMGLFGPKAN